MAKARPYFKFYVSDFLTDSNVRCMNTEQVGAYILLLMQAWTEEPCASLPGDDSRLARLAGLSIERWMESKDIVLAPFTRQTDGRIVQKRLRAEFEAMCREANEKAANGKKGAEKRWQSHGTAMAPPSHHHGYSDANSDSDSDTKTSSSYASASETAVAEELGDRIRLLMSIGLGTGDAAKWAKHANATPERVRFLVAKAASGVWQGKAVANVCAGIRDAWDVPAPEADAKAQRLERLKKRREGTA